MSYFLDGELINSCILARKGKRKTEAHRVQKNMIMCSPQCQKKLFMCSYNSTPLERSAVLKIMIMCSYN